MSVVVTIESCVRDLAVGLVEATGVTIAESGGELVERCLRAVATASSEGPQGGDQRRQAVRRLLRHGGFKPSGRNKPAQEYLLRVASQGGQWPVILNAVDVLNVVSLRSGLPISMMSLSRLGGPLVIRYGLPGEAFVFNQAGQTLDVEGLLCICHQEAGLSTPVGTPVKDSQLAKVNAEDSHILAGIYAPRSAVTPEALLHWTLELGTGLQQWCGTDNIDTRLLPATW